ncbi:thiosulfate oxidation carrier protein SoxY [Thiohalocapsa halophila]
MTQVPETPRGAGRRPDQGRRRFAQRTAGLVLMGCGVQRLARADILPPVGAVDAALAALGAGTEAGAIEAPDRVQLTLPQRIENGAVVPVTVEARLPDVRNIYVLADMNPTPIAAAFRLGAGLAPRLSVRVKLAGSGRVYGAVRTADGLYWTGADATVTVGGCR